MNRKAFNFYKSFFEVANEIPAKYRLEFYESICKYQFEGIEPKLTGVLKLAWAGIKHSLEKQLIGYKSATYDTIPFEGTKEGTKEGTTKGTKGEEQVKEKVKEKRISKIKKKDSLSIERPRNVYGDVFCDWFKNTNGISFNMQTKDWVGIAAIQKYCEENFKNLTEDQKLKFQPIDTFKVILLNYEKLPVFYQENKSPSFISSKIALIISLLKNPAQKQSKQDGIIQSQGDKTNPVSGEYESASDKAKREMLNKLEFNKI